MRTTIPHFKYRSKPLSNSHFGSIELGDEVIHKIDDLAAFHKAFGYTAEVAKAGILPDEFIWEQYIGGSAKNCKTCFQLHIIEYLIEHSTTFRKKYEAQHEDWIAAHKEASSARGEIECPACKTKHPAKFVFS